MTHHTRPYAKVQLDHPTGMDRRRQRRARRTIGQHFAGLRAFANTTTSTADKFEQLTNAADKFQHFSEGAQRMATALGAIMPKAMARAAELDQAEANRRMRDA